MDTTLSEQTFIVDLDYTSYIMLLQRLTHFSYSLTRLFPNKKYKLYSSEAGYRVWKLTQALTYIVESNSCFRYYCNYHYKPYVSESDWASKNKHSKR